VNDLGQAVGQSHPPYRTRAVMWLDDAQHTPVDLGTLPGDLDSGARAINNAGQIVGVSWSEGGASHGFLWQNGEMLELGSLLDASGADWVITYVTAMNNLGQIVGVGTYRGEPRTFRMTPAGR
jgi:probable HAF family extracellular repeat protein